MLTLLTELPFWVELLQDLPGHQCALDFLGMCANCGLQLWAHIWPQLEIDEAARSACVAFKAVSESDATGLIDATRVEGSS